MNKAVSSSESKRLAALRQYGIQDSSAEPALDDLVHLAALICGTPIALIVLVDEHRQWFKARVGLSIEEMPREHSFCTHTIEQGDVLTVNNASKDERFCFNPLVRGEPHICFYAGTPIVTANGEVLGTICIMDSVPHELSQSQTAALQALGRQVMQHLELRLTLNQLEQTQHQLVKTSRQAGMAEISTGVLHNVGNVLNSVNVAASYLADRIKKSKTANLARVVALFREHKSDLASFLTTDAKGLQIPAYLEQLGEHLASEQTVLLHELADLQKNIKHIKEIVTLQQGYARTSGVSEPHAVTNLIDDALQLNASSLERRDIEIIKEYEAVPPIRIERHKVLQILVNLVRNAVQAYENMEREHKKIILRVNQTSDYVRITVSDNAGGIAPENLTCIFSHGFTTKKDGHGFGLHNSARAAKEMGGSLTVHSPGLGAGATFMLELPFVSA